MPEVIDCEICQDVGQVCFQLRFGWIIRVQHFEYLDERILRNIIEVDGLAQPPPELAFHEPMKPFVEFLPRFFVDRTFTANGREFIIRQLVRPTDIFNHQAVLLQHPVVS